MPTEGGGNGGDRPKNSSEDGNKEGEVRGAQVVDNVPGIGYRQDKDGSYSRFDSGHKCGPNCTLDHWTTKDQIRANGELLMLFVGGEAVKWVFRGGKWVLSGTRAAKGVTNLIPEGKLANHLFKGAGKLADNPANRTLIQKIANGKPLGVDAYGKSWYMGVDGAGKSVYTYTQNGVVKGAGYATMTPAEMIAKYGLK